MKKPPAIARVELLGGETLLRFVPSPLFDDGVKCDGLCDAPNRRPIPRIRIDRELRGVRMLDVLIHEALHRAGWHIDEAFVEGFATMTAEMLYDLGYRAPWDSDREE